MEPLKQQIHLQLIANILKSKCEENADLIFRDAWCTQERVIRFTSPTLRQLCPANARRTGKLGTGDALLYEVYNAPDAVGVACVLDGGSTGTELILKEWQLAFDPGDDATLFAAFDQFLLVDRVDFERALLAGELIEGAPDVALSQKYERNPVARARCLAYHGTACKVCGMDFASVYGPEFKGIIEVHHIVPLSQIGEAYVVDPINDLIPVCPNCHAALHSKKDGVYSVEELRTHCARYP